MADITYFILPSVIKDRTGLHSNVADDLIYPEIVNAQVSYLLPLLGSRLYDKIMQQITDDGQPSGYYKELTDMFLVMAMCNWVMAELPPALTFQYWNKGVSTKTVENANEPSMSDIYAQMARYKGRAESYAKRARNYLIQNAPAMFPEYLQPIAGLDQIIPDAQQYTCPIFLGDETETPPDDYSLNKRKPNNFNSNDPYYN